MIDVKISDEIKDTCPNIVLGLLQAKVKVTSSCDSLLSEIEDYCNSLKEQLKLEELTKDIHINDGRESYKKLGKSPSKYRLSSEALVRRILQGKGLYKVNNIVDINNMISIKSRFPVGSYDVKNIKSFIVLDKAKEGSTYKGIGKDFINIEYLPVLCDEEGPFGSPTSDSERAMINNDVEEIVMVIYSFSGENDLENCLNDAKELLEKYAQGRDFEMKIVR